MVFGLQSKFRLDDKKIFCWMRPIVSETETSAFIFISPRKELISSSDPSASAILELLDTRWSQLKVLLFHYLLFGCIT